MALKLTIELPSGAVGDYIRLGPVLHDPIRRELSAHFLLYRDQARRDSHPGSPLGRGVLAKLRLTGEKFDQYLSSAVLAALPTPGPNALADQIYAAAVAEPALLVPGEELTAISFVGAERVD